jgi:hypothetical protein
MYTLKQENCNADEQPAPLLADQAVTSHDWYSRLLNGSNSAVYMGNVKPKITMCPISTGYRDFALGQLVSCDNFDSWNNTLVQTLIRIAGQRAMRDQCNPRGF